MWQKDNVVDRKSTKMNTAVDNKITHTDKVLPFRSGFSKGAVYET